jgi:hypothetical protein
MWCQCDVNVMSLQSMVCNAIAFWLTMLSMFVIFLAGTHTLCTPLSRYQICLSQATHCKAPDAISGISRLHSGKETPYLLAMQPFSLEAILIMHLELYTSHTVKFWSTVFLGRHCSDHVTVGALVSIGLLPAVAVRLQESVRVVQSHSPSPPMSYRNQGATIEAQNPMTGITGRWELITWNYISKHIQTKRCLFSSLQLPHVMFCHALCLPTFERLHHPTHWQCFVLLCKQESWHTSVIGIRSLQKQGLKRFHS